MAKKLAGFTMESLRVPAGLQQAAEMLKKGAPKVSVLGGAVGAGIDVVTATRDERGYMSAIADEYRPEIAERLGLAEKQVTQAHYHQAFAENPVLAQAQQVAKMSGAVRAANSTIATVVGTLAGLAASALSRATPEPGMAVNKQDPANIAGSVAATVGAVAAGKVARKLLHGRKLEKAMESTAHHKIMLIKDKQQRGEEATAVDIFQVQLALNPQVGEAIKQAHGVAFEQMEAEQQLQLLRSEFPQPYEDAMIMAERINRDGVRPQQLLFGAIPEKTRDEPLAAGNPQYPPHAAVAEMADFAVEASGAEEAVAEVMSQQQVEQEAQKLLEQLDATDAVKAVDGELEAGSVESHRRQEAAVALKESESFVERLGADRARQEGQQLQR